jgi:uncharacterized protein YegP (UPF0339 family)
MKRPHVEYYQSIGSGEHHWRLRAPNGRIIASGGEGFSSERKARESYAAVCKYAGKAVERG